MNLIAEASGLVGGLLRARGRLLLHHPDIDWFIAAEVASEVQHELERRLRLLVRHNRLATHRADDLARTARELLTDTVGIANLDVYAPARQIAQGRIVDPNDWPIVALALVIEAGIRAEDRDFLGIGLPVWNTRVLRTYLQLDERR